MRTRPMSGAFVFLSMAMLAAMATLGGCVDNDVSLTIDRFIPPDPASLASGTCKFDPMVTINQTRGSYDLTMASRITTGYDANFVVHNNLLKIQSAPVETQSYVVSSFDVVLEVSGPIQTVIPPSERSFNFKSGSIRLVPGGLAAAYAQILKPSYAKDMLALKVAEPGTIVAHVRAVASRGENQLESAFVDFPIDICNDCLTGAAKGFIKCPYPSATPLPGNSCNPAQDGAIDCCEDSTSGTPVLLCGAAAKPSST